MKDWIKWKLSSRYKKLIWTMYACHEDKQRLHVDRYILDFENMKIIWKAEFAETSDTVEREDDSSTDSIKKM